MLHFLFLSCHKWTLSQWFKLSPVWGSREGSNLNVHVGIYLTSYNLIQVQVLQLRTLGLWSRPSSSWRWKWWTNGSFVYEWIESVMFHSNSPTESLWKLPSFVNSQCIFLRVSLIIVVLSAKPQPIHPQSHLLFWDHEGAHLWYDRLTFSNKTALCFLKFCMLMW